MSEEGGTTFQLPADNDEESVRRIAAGKRGHFLQATSACRLVVFPRQIKGNANKEKEKVMSTEERRLEALRRLQVAMGGPDPAVAIAEVNKDRGK